MQQMVSLIPEKRPMGWPPLAGYPDYGIVNGPMEWALDLPQECADVVWSDPPWSRDALDLYGQTLAVAEQILRPHGLLFMVCGLTDLDRIFQAIALRPTVHYHWLLVGYMPQSNAVINYRKILNKTRPIVLCSRTKEPHRQRFMSDVVRYRRDKRFHEWGHSEEPVRYYLTRSCKPGDMVIDLFCGGGTVPAVAKGLGLSWLAYELDPETAGKARARVAAVPVPLAGCGVELEEAQDDFLAEIAKMPKHKREQLIKGTWE